MDNFLTALTAWEVGEDPAGTIRWEKVGKAVAEVFWPGRLEPIDLFPGFVLDGAHNPAGARACAAGLRDLYPGRPIILILGILADKAVEEICRILLPAADAVITVQPPGKRGLAAARLAEICRRQARGESGENSARQKP